MHPILYLNRTRFFFAPGEIIDYNFPAPPPHRMFIHLYAISVPSEYKSIEQKKKQF